MARQPDFFIVMLSLRDGTAIPARVVTSPYTSITQFSSRSLAFRHVRHVKRMQEMVPNLATPNSVVAVFLKEQANVPQS